MEFFKSLLRAVGLLEPSKVNIISELPMEVSQLILRKLDPESLLCAARVSRNWLEVCRSDRILRRTARRHQRRQRRQLQRDFLCDIPVKEKKIKVEKKKVEEKKIRNIRMMSRTILVPKLQAPTVTDKTWDLRGPPKHSMVRLVDVRPARTMRL